MTEQYIKLVLDENDKYVGAYYVGDNWEAGAPELDTVAQLRPRFELGSKPAVGGKNPSLGSGGALVEYTREEYTNGIRISMDIYIHSVGGSAGVGSGGYEVYLPDDLMPTKDSYVGTANLWRAGGGISEFDGSVKWTMRNQTKGPKLIFTFNGREWTADNPKRYNDFKLRANIRYFL